MDGDTEIRRDRESKENGDGRRWALLRAKRGVCSGSAFMLVSLRLLPARFPNGARAALRSSADAEAALEEQGSGGVAQLSLRRVGHQATQDDCHAAPPGGPELGKVREGPATEAVNPVAVATSRRREKKRPAAELKQRAGPVCVADLAGPAALVPRQPRRPSRQCRRAMPTGPNTF